MSTPEQRREKRRKVVNGFPKDTIFETTEQVKEYLSGDRLQCLLCGRNFKAMTSHLATIHGVDENYYRQRFGIPWTYPMASTCSSESYRNGSMRRQDKSELVDRISRAREVKAKKGVLYRPIQPAIKKQRLERFEKLASVLVTIKCLVCENEVITDGLVRKKLCDNCITEANKLSAAGRERLKQWAIDNPERFKKYNNARQRLFHGDPTQSEEYEREYGVTLRALKSFWLRQ